MNALATIHVAKKQLGLDDDTYRSLLKLVTGKDSAADMDDAERKRVVVELQKRGFKPSLRVSYKSFKGRFAPTMQAFWISGYHLGVVESRQDKALIAFVRRQTGIEHMRWIHDAGDARKVIEALKAWLARAAGVKWPVYEVDAHTRQLAVVEAQLRILGETRDLSAERDLVALMQQLGERIRKAKTDGRV